MTGFHPPENQGSEEEEVGEHGEKRKLPEFIYVDSERKYSNSGAYGRMEEEWSRSFEEIGEKKFSFLLRVVCLASSLFLMLICLIAMPFFLFFLATNLITFFQFGEYWERTKKLWGQIKKMFVTSLGLLIAVFSPAFGLSVIMVYFLLLGQNMDEDWVARLMKARFYSER